MGLTDRGTLVPPFGGHTGEGSAAAPGSPERKVRCFKPDRHRNPCPNEAISDWGLCLTHLQEAHAEYEALLSEALGRHPAGRRR
jgi:hypothetical protein